MVISNANYELIRCGVGKTNRKGSDGGVIQNTKFYEKLLRNRLKIPEIGEKCLHYVFVSDKAFSLRFDRIKPLITD